MLPGLMEEIAALSRKNPSLDRVIKKLGVKRLSSLAIEKGISLEEIFAAVGIYLEELSTKNSRCHSAPSLRKIPKNFARHYIFVPMLRPS